MEEPILERVAAGDPDAVEECISRYKGLVWSLARQRLRQAEAEDAVQEIFIDLWKSAGRYNQSLSSETSFVAMVARRRLIDRLRRGGRRPDLQPIEDTHPGSLSTPGHRSVEAAAEAALAGRVLAELRPEERQAVLLSIHQGMSHSEIAEHTDTPLGTVKTYIRRGLGRVRERLAERDRGPREVPS